MKAQWKPCVAVALLLLGFSALAHAQDQGSKHRGQGYVFWGSGAVVSGGNSAATMHLGAGGEGLAYKGFGLGAEIGYYTPWESIGDGFGLVSANGSYHFTRERKLSPFFTGGYSIGFRSGHINLANFGGGLTYWFKDKTGLRVEFRDHLNWQYYHNLHYLSFRVGLSFR